MSSGQNLIVLPQAREGKVVVCVTLKPSGRMDLGHVRDVLLNEHCKLTYKGSLIVRIDDTESGQDYAHFEEWIVRELELLGVPYDKLVYVSDEFSKMENWCGSMLRNGKAYLDKIGVCASLTEVRERVLKRDKLSRMRSKKWYLEMWEKVKNGTRYGKKYCVRSTLKSAKYPLLYYRMAEPHYKTGHKHKVYPTQEFWMPILDSELGVTHTLYCKPHKERAFVLPEERTPLMCYYEPFQVRDLLQEEMALFVKKDIPCPTYVDTRASTLGWDDPRLPTVYGLIGRGLEPSILREFIMAMGSSSAVKCFQWHILWAKNKEMWEKTCLQYKAVEKDKAVRVFVSKGLISNGNPEDEVYNWSEKLNTTNHGGDFDWKSGRVLIRKKDMAKLKIGCSARLENWGKDICIASTCLDEIRDVFAMEQELDEADVGVTPPTIGFYLAVTEKAPLIPCVLIYYDYACYDEKPKLKNVIAESSLAKVKRGQVIRLSTFGFFICENPYVPSGETHAGETCSTAYLRYIPDGKRGKEVGT